MSIKKDIWDVVVGEFLEDKRNFILVSLFRIHLSSHVDIYSLYRGIFYVGLLDCVRYNEDFVISRFCSIHFTVILAGLKKIVRYTEDFVI